MPGWLRRRIYAGDLLVVRNVAAIQALVEHSRAEICAAFDSADPVHAQCSLDRAEWDRRAAGLRQRYKRDAQARKLMVALFAAFGFDPGRTAADVVNLRCQPHDDNPVPDPRHTLGAHRDTWGSNIYQQINWWAPVFPVTAKRTIALFPGWWSRPLANDSASWDLAASRAEIHAAREEGRKPGYRNVPEPREPVDRADWLPVVIESGDVLVFSGAHLHASVPNASGAARFSLELRSLDLHDAAGGIGAPNIDGAAPMVAWHWFRRLDDNTRVQAPDSDTVLACDTA
ncbi:MAG: phytanoyl-CoA dioxygenase family protein [Woeseiaceae bacterium]|nr:phytanoyl-CoA dioxygenase family protein [Woeseiaceae bacterium]